MNSIVVAIDGFSSCGKSTIAKTLAKQTGYIYVDTGAMYRAVSLFAIQNGFMNSESIDQEKLMLELPKIKITFKTNDNGGQDTYLNGVNVEKDIRTLEVGNGASRISTIGFVRQELVRQQQAMGLEKGIVMDGRDIGTVVFPNAELKLFITASSEVKAKRRFLELQQMGKEANYDDVLANIVERDVRDSTRAESPLRQADDAILIDNSNMTREEQMQLVIDLFNERTK